MCRILSKYKLNFCLNECKIGNYPLSCFLNECDEYPINCYNQTPESYYFDSNNKLYKKCYENCKSCYGEGNEAYNNCKECINNYYFLNESLYETNCYEKCDYYYYFDESNKYYCTLNLSCPVNYKLITSKKKCIDECKNDNTYKYEYNAICYINCPEETIDNNYICYQIENKESTIITQKVEITDIIENKESTIITQKVEITDKIEKIESTIITQKVEITDKIENKESSIISEKETFPIKIESSFIDFNSYNIENQLNLFEKIKKNLLNGYYTAEIDNGKELVFRDINFIYTVTSTKNQKNNKNYNTTVIYLGQCENKLKENYNISQNDSLYILKVDALIDDLNVPKVEYEVFYSFGRINQTQLNLSFCENIEIDIRVPLNISKEDIDKYNSSSNFYNYVCYTLKNEKGVDKPIKTRRDDFIKNNFTSCEEGCKFSEYDIINKAAICSCFTKTKIAILSEIKVDKKKLISNFKNMKNIANFQMLKCINLLFDKKNIFKNLSNYMSIFLVILNTVAIFIFIFYNKIKFMIFINRLIKQNKKINNKNKIKIKKEKKIFKKKIIKMSNQNNTLNINRNRVKKCGYINKSNISINNNKNNINNKFIQKNNIKNLSLKNPRKNNIKNLSLKNPRKNNIKNLSFKNPRKNNIKCLSLKNRRKINIKKPLQESKNKITNKSAYKSYNILKTTSVSIKSNKKSKTLNYSDSEMNNLCFAEAIRIDNRSFCLYYFSLIKSKHILISTFCYFKDYNAQIIKIYLFFFTLASNFIFSAMFYSETTMDKIYLEDGTFDLTYQFPKMAYSFIISTSIKSLLNYFGLYENSLIAIKRNIKSKKGYKKIVLFLKIKIILFFILNYIILSSFWIYLGCFCAVYPNTQIHLSKGVLSSFSLSFVTPFFINLFPAIFRIHSLNSKNKKICLYKFSKILQIF